MSKEYKAYLQSMIVIDTNGCWIWQGGLMGKGYGQSKRLDGDQSAHRNSFKTYKGPIPEGHIVRHTCDVMLCINPEHLVSGTYSDNMADCIERSRHIISYQGAPVSISDSMIAEIRQLSADGYSYNFIVEYTGVSKGYISKIVNRQFRKEIA